MRPDTYSLPKGPNTSLIDPPLSDLPAVVQENRRRLAAADFTVAGVPRANVAAKARAEFLKHARGFTRDLGVEARATSMDVLIATGHQPGMNHPGVWVKNHLVDFLARKLDACGINIVLDTDTPGSLDFAVPVVADQQAKIKHQRPLAVSGAVAVEEQQINDSTAIRDLAQNAPEMLPFESSQKGARQYLKYLSDAATDDTPVSHALAAARRKVEAEWGLGNLELPYSQACQFDAFNLLVLEILRRAEEFATIYNQKLGEYRKQYKVRGKANPLPNLAVEANRVELPLWIWKEGGERQNFIFRKDKNGWNILLNGKPVQTFTPEMLNDAEAGLRALRQVAQQGIRIRSKALVTTIYMRLFLFDLFVHGIGGGNYDIITDEIIRDFFGMEPPAYAVATANAALPFEKRQSTQDDHIRLQEYINRMHYGPANYAEEFLPDDREVTETLKQRQTALQRQQQSEDKAERRELFNRIKAYDTQLRTKISPIIIAKRNELHEIENDLHFNEVVGGREYPFCIYPENVLRQAYGFRDEQL